MPELPDITVYIESLAARILGSPLERLRLASPFFLRSVDPAVREVEGKRVAGLRRIGKHVVLALEADLFVVIHLMIAGRLHWKERGAKIPARVGLAAFDFPTGTLIVTEASTRKRASLHLARGEAALAQFDRGGLEVFDADLAAFKATLRRERHTVKRALTDPTLFSGIGNAYSDEILFHARLSP
ncbi:MAG: DNA-formamidopyrimidine glycosylase family protein, partial [Candidatus Methylomirabilaceae bacterium]